MDKQEIPFPWEVRVSSKYNRHFYFNKETRESVWELPLCPSTEEAGSFSKRPMPISTPQSQNKIDDPKYIPNSPLRKNSFESPYARKPSRGLEPQLPAVESLSNNLQNKSADVSVSSDTSVISQLSDPTYCSNTDISFLQKPKSKPTMMTFSQSDPLVYQTISKSMTPSNLSSLNMVGNFGSEMIRSSSSTTPSPKATKRFNFIRSMLPQLENSPGGGGGGGGRPMTPTPPRGGYRISRRSSSNFASYIRKRLHFMSSFSSNSSMASSFSNFSTTSATSPTQNGTTSMESNQPPLLKEVSYEESDAEEEIKQYIQVPVKVLGGLGRGGYSIVLKAKHLKTNQIHALKIVSKERASRTKDQDRLKRELLLMTELNSRFLQRCHLCFESSRDLFFLLDFIDGGDLFYHLCQRQLKRKRGFTEVEISVLLSEVYLGLTHLHDYGYIHRDIKIENIMLCRDGHIKLVDFGLAIGTDSRSSLCGSLLYMSPEMLKEHRIGTFTDWWSVGITFYELFTGQPPWSSFQDKHKIRREIMTIVVAPPPRLSFIGGKFLMGLLKHDYKERLGSKDDKEVAESSFFSNIDWEKTNLGQNKPAFLPCDIFKEQKRKSFVSKMKEEIQSGLAIKEHSTSSGVEENDSSATSSPVLTDKKKTPQNISTTTTTTTAIVGEVTQEEEVESRVDSKELESRVGDGVGGIGPALTMVLTSMNSSVCSDDQTKIPYPYSLSNVIDYGGTDGISEPMGDPTPMVDEVHEVQEMGQQVPKSAEVKEKFINKSTNKFMFKNEPEDDKIKEKEEKEKEEDNYHFFDEECSTLALKEYIRKCSVVALENNDRTYYWKFGVDEIKEYPIY